MEEWLASIGLGARIAAFKAHGITSEQLGQLTDADLRELGLTIGERKRFRAELPRFHAAGEGAGIRAERRPLTIMFVDLVASSALAERLEAEDLLDVIRGYREMCGAAITQYGGMIARVVGDGILAYFGYPVAHENDPERGVRAALQIVSGIGRLATPTGERLEARIGMSTGRVIISDLFAGGSTDLRSIIGSTPNLAARLQSLASPGGIVISDETHQRIAALFLCEDLGELRLHGFDQPHRAWRVTGPAFIRSRLTRSRRRLTPFFNRKADRAVLEERWAATCRGEAAVVLVMGEAGIGKSRLIQQFVSTKTGPDSHAIRFITSPFGEDSPLHPLIGFLTAAARITPE
ncbi:MAG: hypothetical protein JO227_17825, partial [Acetobacteraceae bacterium]|nr:hypothetical protein [Acetobacteraceae bacterium]